MTQVLSKLSSSSSGALLSGNNHLSRLAVASSGAALAYWAYLMLSTSSSSSSSSIKARHKQAASSQQQQQQQPIVFLDTKARSKTKRPDFGVTLRHLSVILKSIMSYRDIALCCGVTLGLIFRTLLDLWNIQISTKVESAIITANTDQLRQTLISFAVTTPTLAFVNNMIKYFTDKLSLRIRYNLSKVLYDKYMTELTFYHLSQQQDFQNVDQLLTADVDKFASSIVEVYNNISKPILDIILLVHRMSSSYTGGSTPAIMIGWLALVGTILTQARKPLAGYIIRETQAEGQLRFVHSRLIQNNEEIAFFKGNNKEKSTLMSSLDTLKDSLDDLILFKFKIGMMDNIVGRYSSTVVGYLALALPFFSARYAGASSEERLNQYYISGRMMMKLAESITRVIMAGQDLARLSAYTQRVKSLMDSMDALTTSGSSGGGGGGGGGASKRDKRVLSAGGGGELEEAGRSRNRNKRKSTSNNDNDAAAPSGTGSGDQSSRVEVAQGIEGGGGGGSLQKQRACVEICDKNNPMIDFKNVTLCTPNGDILVKDLTFTIKPNQSVIIAGPNGSGKSSLFRVLGDLWQVESGKLIRPPTDQLFYICQKPYMTLGTLRNQIIFPDSHSKLSDSELVDTLGLVELKYLLEREHTLDSIQDWQDVLSGGEKQRMALARLIYHKPMFAILDECTSAVAIDVEQRIYKYLCESLNCTLLSVTHRVKQLAKFHHLILEFDGNGSFEFKRLTAPL